MIVGDEAHLFKAVSLTKILTKLEKCPYRVGLTGTLDGSKTHKLVLEGLVWYSKQGGIHIRTTRKGKLADLKIYLFSIKTWYDRSVNMLSGMNYQEEMDYIVQSDKRNKYIETWPLAYKVIHYVCFSM